MLNDIIYIIQMILFGVLGVIIFREIIKTFLAPLIVKKTIKEIEKNPKWLTPKLQDKYYGFSNIDIITAESSVIALPHSRLSKDKSRIEILISEDTSINDIDEVAAHALRVKIYIQYHLLTPKKPAYWLSILCYMLDRGDIRVN